MIDINASSNGTEGHRVLPDGVQQGYHTPVIYLPKILNLWSDDEEVWDEPAFWIILQNDLPAIVGNCPAWF